MLKINSETKLSVSKGCLDYLVQEVEGLRQANRLQGAQLAAYDNVFELVHRLNGPRAYSEGLDRLWQAKREITDAERDVPLAPTPEPTP